MPMPDLPFPVGPVGSDAYDTSGWLMWLVEQVNTIGAPVLASATSDYQILTSDSGTQFDNYGAAGVVTLTLPPWVAGLRYSFVVVEPFYLTIDTTGVDTINVMGQMYGSVFSSMQYALLSVGTSNAPGAWVVTATAGAWSYA